MADQYYTKPQVAQRCWNVLLKIIEEEHDLNDCFFIEPSSGNGSFYDLLPEGRRLGMDIEPRHPEVREQNFFTYFDYFSIEQKPIITVGNPPFGHDSKIAIEFIDHASIFSDIIAFILPNGFNSWIVHKKLDHSLRLIKRFPLEQKSFYLPSGKDYGVNSHFEVYVKGIGYEDYTDQRIRAEPRNTHPDFTMRAYVNRPSSLKFLNQPFDLAVPLQGWVDYTRRETDRSNCETTRHWMLFRSDSEEVLERLTNLDYDRMSKENTTITPGYNMRDVVAEYTRLYGG